MKVEQFVMAYRGDREFIGELLPEGYELLRPVLRINAEILTDESGADDARQYNYIEFNTPVAHDGKRGWMNLGSFDSMSTDIRVAREGRRTTFIFGWPGLAGEDTEFNAGSFGASPTLPKGTAEPLSDDSLARGVVLKLSHTPVGVEGGCPAENDNDGCFYQPGTEDENFQPAEKVEEKKEYTDCSFAWGVPSGFMVGGEMDEMEIPALFRAMQIPCDQVLGAYTVIFNRENSDLRVYK